MISQTVSHYRIVGKLGAGGMGEVYLAEDVRLGRQVALKFLSPSSQGHRERATSFLKEARAASALRSPNIAAIFDIGEHDGALFIVMEYVEGKLVSGLIERGPLPVEQVLGLAVQAADGLAEAHSHGIVHCDVKSSNLIVNERGILKILDFGIARVAAPVKLDDTGTEALSSGDATKVIFGTLSYMSPEQALGSDVDQRSDIFSLGVVLYEMLTGMLPFRGASPSDTIDRILHQQPAPISRFSDSVPAELERIVLRCLEKDRDRRYQSMREVLTDLRNLQGDSDSGVTLELNVRTQTLRRPRSRKSIDSLAILPFENDSGDPELEYFSDGITESIINNISQLPSLRVMARSTVFRYKTQNPELGSTDPRGAGQELNVRAVLTGRVLQRGDRLVVKTELVDTTDGSQLWGEQYHRQLADIFAIEEEIAKEISEKLRLKLTTKQRNQLSKRHTRNARAYQHYLKGRYYWNKRTEESVKKGIEEFHQAIGVDPNYALAYAGLADSYIVLSGYSLLPEEVFPTAKAAAMKALRLDDTLAEAHTSLAAVRMWYEWDWEGAERKFNRAIELNASYPTAYLWYALNLAARQRLDEALTAVRRAQELDPLSLIINLNVARILYFARRYDDAIEQCAKVLEMDPNFALAQRRLGQVYTQRGMFKEAIAEFQKALANSPDDSETMSAMAFAYSLSGDRQRAQSILGQVETLSKQTYVSPYSMARIFTGLGDKDRAFEWLDKTHQQQHGILGYLQVEPLFDSLRDDPRFADLLRSIGLAR